MSDVAAQALQEQWARISERTGENQWLTRERVRGCNTKFARRLPPCRCRSHVWRSLLTVARYGVSVWPGYRIAREVGSSIIRRMLMPCWKRMPTFTQIESSPLNPSRAGAVVNGESSLLVLAGAGSGKTSVLVARAGWLLARGQADAGKFFYWRLVARRQKRWMSVSASAYIRKRLLPVRSIRWRCILFSKAVKSAGCQ